MWIMKIKKNGRRLYKTLWKSKDYLTLVKQGQVLTKDDPSLSFTIELEKPKYRVPSKKDDVKGRDNLSLP